MALELVAVKSRCENHMINGKKKIGYNRQAKLKMALMNNIKS